MKKSSVHVKNISIKQLCVWDVATAFRVRRLFGAFEKLAPDIYFILHARVWYWRSVINSVKGQELMSPVFKRTRNRRKTFILSAGKLRNSDCDNLFIVLHKYIFYFAGTEDTVFYIAGYQFLRFPRSIEFGQLLQQLTKTSETTCGEVKHSNPLHRALAYMLFSMGFLFLNRFRFRFIVLFLNERGVHWNSRFGLWCLYV